MSKVFGFFFTLTIACTVMIAVLAAGEGFGLSTNVKLGILGGAGACGIASMLLALVTGFRVRH